MTARVRVELDWPAHNAVRVGDTTYFCLELDGVLHLLPSRCPHRGGPLHLGRVERGWLTCPWHGTRFRLGRMCATGVPAVRTGDLLVAYVPAEAGSEDLSTPVPVRQMVLAQEELDDVAV